LVWPQAALGRMGAMYIGGGAVVLVLVILLIVFLVRRA
jgi:hypothetical protein